MILDDLFFQALPNLAVGLGILVSSGVATALLVIVALNATDLIERRRSRLRGRRLLGGWRS